MKKLIVSAVSAAALAMPSGMHYEIVPNAWPPSAYKTIVGDADKPITTTITAAWIRIPFTAARRDIENDGLYWRSAYFGDWDTLPDDVRENGLRRMLEKYGRLIYSLDAWPQMTQNDWDAVPQPVRAMAFMKMLDYWSGVHTFKTEDGSDTLKAIVMGESWFEHRAVNKQKNNTDIGLLGASNYARKAINSIYKRDIKDEDYFNPYVATEAATLWLGRMLQEARGDRSLAIRAYYRGIRRAKQGDGTEYLDKVNRIRDEYIRNMGNSPSWQFLYKAASSRKN